MPSLLNPFIYKYSREIKVSPANTLKKFGIAGFSLIKSVLLIDIKDYEKELKSNSSIAPTIINRRLVSLKQWTEFMSTNGYTPFNLGSNVKVKKIQRQNNIRWLTRKEVGRLLHAIEITKQENYIKGLFHQVVIYLMVNLGLRARETCDLRISQIVQHKNIVNDYSYG